MAQQQQQRPPPRTRSSTALSSSSVSSSLPGSPGPSVSVRAMARSTTPVATPALSVSAKGSPGPPGYLTARTMSTNSSSGTSNAGPSTYKPSRPGHARDRSTSGFSVTTSASTRTAHHSRRQQTFMGGNPNSKLSRSHLATYNSTSAMDRNNSGMISPPVPDILINGAERPEDVDIASIGRLPSLSAASPVRSSPEATSVGVDSLFAKFGVKEVKSIAVRGRAKAESKREELRTMVGERYRDLLGAADSIVRMRKSSSVLLDRLGRARQECDRDAMHSRAAEEDMTRSHMLSRATTPLVSGHTPYSVATLVKLLLDCPEHIWRCIERQDYLSAARLDSVGRAVYRELVSAGKRKASTSKQRRRGVVTSDDDDDSGGYDSDEEDDEDGGLLAAFPLVKHQFDTLDSLAPQISSRATMHLRAWEVSAMNVSDSLATLIMLDRISMADGLQLLLDQRSKTLATLFQEALAPTTPSLRRPSARPTISNNDVSLQSTLLAQTPESKAVHDAVSRTIEAIAVILVTQEHVKACFTPSSDNNDPLLLKLLRMLQESASNPAESPNTTLSMIQAQSAGKLPSESLQPILVTLPNAHLFLRYLPEQILSFTPYIDIESADSHLSAESIDDKLTEWFDNAIKTFESGVTNLYESVGAAAQLADARVAIRDFLSKRPQTVSIDMTAQIDRLRSTLEAGLGERFVNIYNSKLDNIAKTVPQALEGALRALPSSPEDLHPVDFIFSPSLPFPSSSIFPGIASNLSTTTLGKTVTLDPFAIFKKAMQDRVSGRSPVLSECLQQLEVAAVEMQGDMSSWLDGVSDASAREAYSAAARQGLNKIENTLRRSLESQNQTAEQLFVGSVALHLAMNSSFVQSLLLLPSTHSLPDSDKQNLLEIEALSRQQWCTANVQKAIEQLKASLHNQLDLPSPEHPGVVLNSLSLLVDAANQLGAHRNRAIPAGVQELLRAYEQSLFTEVFNDDLLGTLKSIKKPERTKQAQHLLSNFAFLRHVLSAIIDSNAPSLERWHSVEQSIQEIAGETAMKDDQSSSTLPRTQNYLAPLLFNSERYSTWHKSSDASALLPFGNPSAAMASENMLDLAKPGPRLALLPVNATAA